MIEREEMPSTVFRLVYDGEALRDGEMDVADLAPALLAIGQLAQASGRVLLGEKADVKVRVKTLKDGSFDIWLDVAVSYWQQVRDIFGGADVSAAKNLVELLFGKTVGIIPVGAMTGGGVVWLVRRLRGRNPDKATRTSEGQVVVEIDGDRFEVPDDVFRAAMTQTVRDALEKTISDPLAKDGIDIVEFRKAGSPPVTIPKQEGEFFRSPAISVDGEFETKHTKVFSIVSLSFKHGNKWKLSDGHGAAKSVVMLDEDFLARVDRNEVRFGNGDVLICDVREIARQTTKGLRAEYQILRVVEHRPAGDTQGRFPF